MATFKNQLNEYLENRIDLAQLEATLEAEVNNAPLQATNYKNALRNLSNQNVIQPEVCERLCTVIDGCTSGSQSAIIESSMPEPAPPEVGVFESLLEGFGAHEVGYKALEKGLLTDLTVHPENKDNYADLLNELLGKAAISKPVFDDLIAAIDEHLSQQEGQQKMGSSAPHGKFSGEQVEPAGEDFPSKLALFLAHRLGYEQLEKALLADIGKNEQNRQPCTTLLETTFAQGKLKKVVYEALLQNINPQQSVVVEPADIEPPVEVGVEAIVESAPEPEPEPEPEPDPAQVLIDVQIDGCGD
ncbi:MAG: hypothetical protein HRT35_03060 [Algicola sp.]|nr:hypothetical protein [Algicola sp.]